MEAGWTPARVPGSERGVEQAGEALGARNGARWQRRQKRRLGGGASSRGFVSCPGAPQASAQCLGACSVRKELAAADSAATGQRRHATHLRARSWWRRPLPRAALINAGLRAALPGAQGGIVQPALLSGPFHGPQQAR